MHPQGLFATFVLLIIHFVCALFCVTIFFQFLLGVTVVPRQIEAQAYAKFLGDRVGGGGGGQTSGVWGKEKMKKEYLL